jgi:hypothetical protein
MRLNQTALVWLVLLLAASGTPASGQDIHFLLFADTGDASLGRCCSTTVQRVTDTLSYLIPPQRYTLRIFESGRRDYNSAESVLRAVRDIHVPRGDTLVFFYHGHGGNSGGRHFLHMPNNGRLLSDDLKATVRAKSCRLAIIMTCSCNVPIRGVDEAAAAAEEWNVTTQGMAPVMEELFLNHTGLYHTNSSWPNQKSWSDTGVGSWFFHVFCSFCSMCPTARPTWWCMDRMFDRNLKARFAMFKENEWFRPGDVGDQETQHTIYWAPLPKALNFERRRFGAFTSDDNVRTGVEVLKVYPGESAEAVEVIGGGGASRTSLRRGDVLLEINGEEITDWNTYFELVRLSPRRMPFTFRRDGRIYSGEAVLDY